ncbi:hypothetical protein MKO06_14525 [Gramella sp. GC03-9]|uniref:Lipoprotein n=1 Tax=Christiangramia oceanisediminis TaxID=2920386 RepID=A0A9X2RD35_9FLAO|nr:hypothetical protein [Gramella oceanisediminis]MCP9201130.1 hypothetical protein [Gramella oceanisediminis]
MKKIIYLMALVVGLSGCSVESIDSGEEIISADARGGNNPQTQEEEENDVPVLFSPNETCAGEVTEFCLSFPQATAGRNNKESQVLIDVKVMGDNPETEEIEEDYYEELFRGKGDTQACFEYTFEIGTYDIRYMVAGESKWTEDSIIVSSCSDCTNEMTADLTCDETRVLNISFTAEEAGPIVIQGGLTNGTTILVKESNVLNENSTHQSVINSNANVTRWVGDVDACEEVTVQIEFTGGNGVGDWTAERGEELLGITPEISCQEE